MSIYTNVTEQLGDLWIAALKRAEQAVDVASDGLAKAGSTARLDKLPRPELPRPEVVTNATGAISARLSSPREVVAANFALAQRLLDAQQQVTLRLLDVTAQPLVDVTSGPAAAKPAAASRRPRATAKTTTAKA
jgi:hypothetical protein